jgi:hypothetical protein
MAIYLIGSTAPLLGHVQSSFQKSNSVGQKLVLRIVSDRETG